VVPSSLISNKVDVLVRLNFVPMQRATEQAIDEGEGERILHPL
jgi:hypothetical protein